MATIVAPRPLAAERRFYLSMTAAILFLVFAGFAPSFYLRGLVSPYAPVLPLSPLVVAHGLLFTSWAVLFGVQVGLVSAGRTDLHRRLGVLGLGLVSAMAVVGMLAALHGVARHSGAPDLPPLVWMAVPFFDVPLFVGLIGTALYKRRVPQTHKRLMLIAMIGMLAPAVGRLPWPAAVPLPAVIFGVQALFLTPMILWDLKSRGRVHQATIGGCSYLVGSWVLRLAVWQTPAWLGFAGWAASLVA